MEVVSLQKPFEKEKKKTVALFVQLIQNEHSKSVLFNSNVRFAVKKTKTEFLRNSGAFNRRLLQKATMYSAKAINIAIIGISLFASCWANNNLQTKYEWKTIDFNYETTAARQEAIDSKAFIPSNVIPVGLDVHENRLFLSLPRLQPGVPASLAYIQMNGKNKLVTKKTD